MKGFVLGVGCAALLSVVTYLGMKGLWVSSTAAYSPATVTVEEEHRTPLSALTGAEPAVEP